MYLINARFNPLWLWWLADVCNDPSACFCLSVCCCGWWYSNHCYDVSAFCPLHVPISVCGVNQWEVMQQKVACFLSEEPVTHWTLSWSFLSKRFELAEQQLFLNRTNESLFALPVCRLLAPQEELQVHHLMNLYLYQPAAAPPPPPPPPPLAPVDPVQQSQSSACTTAQREPPPAPSSWTSPMSGEWYLSSWRETLLWNPCESLSMYM